MLVTDINNRYLDNNTKEEVSIYFISKIFNKTNIYLNFQLQLFLNQICSCTIEFNANGFFTLNNHLITSVS